MFGMKFSGKTTPPEGKTDVQISPVSLPLPATVLLPLRSTSDLPLTAAVKLGDSVKRGQAIAGSTADLPVLHAPITGKIGKPEDYLTHDGKTVPAIRIDADGEDTLFEEIVRPTITDMNTLEEAVGASGIVDRKGTPLASLLHSLSLQMPKTIVLNGAEDEGMSVADIATILERTDALLHAIAVLKQYAPEASLRIALKKNDTAAIRRVREALAESGVTPLLLGKGYPQSHEASILSALKASADDKVLILNVTAVADMADYLESGLPATTSTLTLFGSAVSEPKNVTVAIGTSIADCLTLAGINVETVKKVVIGNPLSGRAASSLAEPIVKGTSALYCMTEEEAKAKPESACTRCARCLYACPAGLDPAEIVSAMNVSGKEERVALLKAQTADRCLSCGSCTYVCPSYRPLAHTLRLAKKELQEAMEHEKGEQK